MKPLAKRAKIDTGLVPQTLNNTNAIGKYYNMSSHRKALAALIAGAMAAGKTTSIEILQATDAAGANAKGIPSSEGQAAIATITANTAVSVATLTIVTAVAGNAVTINGVTFMAIANGGNPNAANHEWAVGTGGTADADSATALANAINNTTYGVNGVTATTEAGVVTLTAAEPGEKTVTITNPAATITPATVQALGYVEIDAAQLDTTNGFSYIAAKVTTTANTVVGSLLLRGDSRFEPDQSVGAGVVV